MREGSDRVLRGGARRPLAGRLLTLFGVALLGVGVVTGACGQDDLAAKGPWQATGFKVGEVTGTSAIVWTRLTRVERPRAGDAPAVRFELESGATVSESKSLKDPVRRVLYPEGMSVADIRHAVPGARGSVRVRFRRADLTEWSQTGWQPVLPEQDFTRQFALENLEPGSSYELAVESRDPSGRAGQTLDGEFRTAPAPSEPARVVFTVSTGQAFRDRDLPRDGGYGIYDSMLALNPDFFVHTGDVVYYDRLAKTRELALYHWQRMYGLPSNVRFHRRVSSYFMKDDHDTWQNDCWPGLDNRKMFQFTFEQGQAIFRQQVPMGEKTYRTYTWGEDLQVWLLEARDFRSPNVRPDRPRKTILGRKQKSWLRRTLRKSTATFRVIISPTPIVGPDDDSRNDNHATASFRFEGEWLRRFLAEQKNTVVVAGDRHWQYASVDPGTGLREYSGGPASDRHAGGWARRDYRDDYHRFLRVKGGFLSATVDRNEGTPELTFRFHKVGGEVRFEDTLRAE